MVELVGVHGLHEAQMIRDLGEVRHAVRDPCAALAVLLERVLWAEHFWNALDERELFTGQKRLRAFLAVELFELGFVIEEFELARSTGHVQVNHALCAGRKMGFCREQRLSRVFFQRTLCGLDSLRAEPECAEASGAVAQKMAAGLEQELFVGE
jgi:hypothetical protein